MIADDILASNISWETDHVTASVDEALSASESRGADEGRIGKDDAADFLRAVLAAGAMPVLEIEQEARAAGLLAADRSVFRSARTLLGITPRRTGGTGASGKWVWELIEQVPGKRGRATAQSRSIIPANKGGLRGGELLDEAHLYRLDPFRRNNGLRFGRQFCFLLSHAVGTLRTGSAST
jgi:putative DNA primase/helicase